MTAAMAELGLDVAGIGGKVEAKNSEQYQHALSVAKEYITSKQFNDSLTKAENAYMQQTANNTDSVVRTGSEEISNAREQAVKAEHSYAAALSHEKAVSETKSTIEATGVSASVDITSYVKDRLQHDKDDKESWENFNNKLGKGDSEAMAKLERYKNDYAQQYVTDRVNTTQATMELKKEGQENLENTDNKGQAKVATATNTGDSAVNSENNGQGTGSDAARIIASIVAAVSATSDSLLSNISGTINSDGAVIANDAQNHTTGPAGETVVEAVNIASDTNVLRQVFDEGARAIDFGLKGIGVPVEEIDKFLRDHLGGGGQKALHTPLQKAEEMKDNGDRDQ